MLLLIIAISAVSVIYFQVLSDDGPPPTTIVKIVGKGEGEHIYLEHMGGEDINLEDVITYSIGNEDNTSTIGKLIEEDKKPLGVWNLGERLIIPIHYALDSLDDRTAQITGIDTLSNSIVFYGPITLPQPVSDVSVNLEVIHTPPIKGGDEVIVIITITSSGGNVEGAGDVTVQYRIPEGLDYVSSVSPTGHNDDYNPETGYWQAGNVKNEEPAQIVITLTVNETFTRRPTQLALVIDGSGSIIDFDWNEGTDYYKSGSTSAKSTAGSLSDYYLHKGKLGCNSLDASGPGSITIDFWYRLYDTYGTVEYGDVRLECFNGNEWNEVDSLGGEPVGEWNPYSLIIDEDQYLIPNFKIRFNSERLFIGTSHGRYHHEMIWIDDIVIQKNGNTLLEDSFEGDPWDANWRSDWDMTLFGLSNAIKNESVFPIDGSVELTIIQFGYSKAVRELSPIKVNSSSIAENIADLILNINQRKQGTPMSAGMYLATDQLLNSNDFNTEERQAFVIVTDGQPTECLSRPDVTNYPNGPYSASSCNEDEARLSAEDARTDMRSNFNMSVENNTIDEIDVLAIGAGPDINWLNSSIIWPYPYIWELQTDSFNGPGWVTHIDSFEQFDFAIKEMFAALFSISNSVNFVSSTTYDPNPENHKATVTIS
jgi:hypothetical protein